MEKDVSCFTKKSILIPGVFKLCHLVHHLLKMFVQKQIMLVYKTQSNIKGELRENVPVEQISVTNSALASLCSVCKQQSEVATRKTYF